jgi:hypothetical protein
MFCLKGDVFYGSAAVFQACPTLPPNYMTPYREEDEDEFYSS